MNLADKYSRGINPLVQLLDLEGATIDAHVAQLGIAIEAIGYQALIDSGMIERDANRKSVKERIDHLLLEVAGALDFDHATFVQNFADTYNSVKHANRDIVGPEVKVENYRKGVTLLRAWVAVRLGVKKSVLVTRF
ncbi:MULTISPECIES: HEPN domain-containing protein [unclassified Spirillospora]|uniref:HEPN domain-containing protein n=1 Tax=unclassified Spirillospora TaxID=2642701 RepID=UPI0037105990